MRFVMVRMFVQLCCFCALLPTILAASMHESPRDMHARGLAHLRRNERAAARDVLERLRETHPDSPHCALLAGHCCLMLDRSEQEAIVQYQRGECVAVEPADVADAKHAIGRLHRMGGRWEAAARSYHEAHSLQPESAEFEQDLLFAQAKVHLLAGQPREAAAALERGFALAEAAWRPHFARELAHATGLAGDFEGTARHYAIALSLGGVRDHATVGEALSALAAHHEQADVRLAAGFLRGAASAFAAAAGDGSPDGAPDASSAAAAAHRRAAETEEALHALGEAAAEGSGGALASGWEGRLAAAQSHYERALALQPGLVEAYDGLGRLLLGTSRLSNFGAVHAAALHVREAEALLRTAAALDGAPSERPRSEASGGGAQADEEGAKRLAERRRWRAAQLAFIDRTRREVEGWSEVVRSLGPPPPPSSASRSAPAAAATAGWEPPSWLAGAPEIARKRAPSSEAEMRAVVEAGEPVVLVGLQQATGFAPASRWGASALRAACGDSTVKVGVSPTGRYDGPEAGHRWGLPAGREVLVRPPETFMRLGDYLRLLEEPTPESFYVEYNALHQYLGAPVRAMAPVPPQALYLRPLLANLWLGKGATTSPLHYDEYENLLAQVSGTKELVLFPPSDLPHLYYTPRAKGTLRYAWPNTFERLPVREADAGARVVFASSVNVSQPDLRAHPALQRASPRRCTLRPGETLYLPAFWHHEVHSRCAAQGELNVAVNFWFRNATRPPEGFP